jgi:hypothetical protein
MFGENDPKILSTGRHMVTVPAGAMVARTTNGATFARATGGTNVTIFSYFQFSGTSQQFVQFVLGAPRSWNPQCGLYAKFIWFAETLDSNSVTWTIRASSSSLGESIDPAWGTTISITQPAASGSATNMRITQETSPIFVSNNPQPEDWLNFEISRDAAAGSDTSTGAANLLGVHLFFTYSQTSDD